jgi:hypothetical protein
MGCKANKEPQKLRLKPSVAQQMMDMDQARDLTSRFDSDGELSYCVSQLESSRRREPTPRTVYPAKPTSQLLHKIRRRVGHDPNKVVNIEIQRCKGKLGLSSLKHSARSELSPSTAPSLSPRQVDCSSLSRTFMSRSPRPTDLSLAISPRKGSPVLDPSVEDLFVEQPRKGRSLFTAVRKSVPLHRQKAQAHANEEIEQPKEKSLIPMLKEAAVIAQLMPERRRRVGVHFMGSQQRKDDGFDARLSPLFQILPREETPAAHLSSHHNPFSRLQSLVQPPAEESAPLRRRASQLWKWKGAYGSSPH